jgi:hypothetical protein
MDMAWDRRDYRVWAGKREKVRPIGLLTMTSHPDIPKEDV